MMKRARRNRPALLLNFRWAAYATAAAASAFGAGAAEGEIHYSGVIRQNIINPGGFATATFPLSNGASFQLANFSAVGLYNTARFEILGAAVSHAVRAHPPLYFAYSISRLAGGVPVSRGNFYQTSSPMQGNIRSHYGGGNWSEGGQGFIGFKFNAGAGTQYGWVRIKIAPAFGVKMVMIDYAWADPGERIKTGQTSSRPKFVSVPSSGSLGLLALGAKGLIALRGERAAPRP